MVWRGGKEELAVTESLTLCELRECESLRVPVEERELDDMVEMRWLE